MTRRIKALIFVLTLLTTIVTSPAQIHISGPQTGVLVDTTYIVDGPIYVPVGQRLFIAPGAVFLFSAHTDFNIYGYLHAVGTENDSIIFRPRPGHGWNGIRFLDTAADSSLIEYSLITGSLDWGLYFYHSSPTVNHCSIVGNITYHAGGGIFGDHSNSRFSHCLISSNWADIEGGGIEWDYGNIQLEDCVVSNNTTDLFGAGIEVYGGSGLIVNCLITNNISQWGGGGIAIFDPLALQIINCTINYNRAIGASGGGIDWLGGNVQVTDCIISDNASQGIGGGISVFNATGLIDNCLITNNVSRNVSQGGGGIATYSYYSPTVQINNCTIVRNRSFGTFGGGISGNNHTGSGCIIWGNLPDQIFGNGPYNYCDIQGGYFGAGNINADPLFVAIPSGNYYLSQLAAGQTQQSPCVDAGNPASLMLRGTTRTDGIQDDGVIDMGYHFPIPENPIASAASCFDQLGTANSSFKISATPNPFNPTTAISYELQTASRVNLAIYDISGRLVTILVDGWREAGSHQVIFDGAGLTSGVYLVNLKTQNQQAMQKLVLLK